mmetsp:Transcript_5354/g.15625  ORF Transcript_5354/g.15625 Transcript_5354/m.15625 type:complete len:86 (+) Transcript_5354:831-1088(+)
MDEWTSNIASAPPRDRKSGRVPTTGHFVGAGRVFDVDAVAAGDENAKQVAGDGAKEAGKSHTAPRIHFFVDGMVTSLLSFPVLLG